MILTSALQPGDRLVLSELSRLGRSLGQVVAPCSPRARPRPPPPRAPRRRRRRSTSSTAACVSKALAGQRITVPILVAAAAAPRWTRPATASGAPHVGSRERVTEPSWPVVVPGQPAYACERHPHRRAGSRSRAQPVVTRPKPRGSSTSMVSSSTSQTPSSSSVSGSRPGTRARPSRQASYSACRVRSFGHGVSPSLNSPWRKSRIRPGPGAISSRTLKSHGDGQETDSTTGVAALGDDG